MAVRVASPPVSAVGMRIAGLVPPVPLPGRRSPGTFGPGTAMRDRATVGSDEPVGMRTGRLTDERDP